jgi:hypothetical protein
MRLTLSDKLEDGRILGGDYSSHPGETWGAFAIQGPCGMMLAIISSGADAETGWEHVSVSGARRVPNWNEMCFVKNLFWEEEECVMQLHPPKSEYVNLHPHCLHLWRSLTQKILMPPSILVGSQ